MFELIEPKSLPSLYGMLALALHDVSIVEEEEEIDSLPSSSSWAREESPLCASSSGSFNSTTPSDSEEEEEEQQEEKHVTSASSSSHLSITLPCKSFCESSCRYNITVSNFFLSWHLLLARDTLFVVRKSES